MISPRAWLRIAVISIRTLSTLCVNIFSKMPRFASKKRIGGFRKPYAKKPMLTRRKTGKQGLRKNPVSKSWRTDSVNVRDQVQRPFSRIGQSTFPPRTYFCEKYTDIERTLNTTLAGVAGNSFLYRLNDVFDPYFAAGGGGPPEWFNILSQIYNKYLVTSCDVSVRLYKPTANTIVVGAVIQAAGATDDPSGKTVDYFEQRRDYATAPMTSTTGEGSYKEINFHVDLPTLEGLTRQQWESQADQYGAFINADPVRQNLMRVAAGDVDGNSGSYVEMQVSIVYRGYFYALQQS